MIQICCTGILQTTAANIPWGKLTRQKNMVNKNPLCRCCSHRTPPPPPGVLHNWDFNRLSRKEVLGRMTKLTCRLKKTYAKVGKAKEVSFSAVAKPIFDSHRWFFNEGVVLTFPSDVALSEVLRDACNDAQKLMDEALIEVSMMAEPFQKLKELRKSQEFANLDPEHQRGLNRLIHEGERKGLHLDPEIRANIKTLSIRMASLETDFKKNVAADATTLLFTAEELSGVTLSFLSSLEKDPSSGKYKVTMKYPHVLPIASDCTVPETRKKVHRGRASVAKDLNTPILEELLELRQQIAGLLAYPNHAAYILEDLMSKSPEAVDKFLSDLTVKLQPLWKAEKDRMLGLKEEECKANGWEYSGTLELWDHAYYGRQVEEKFYSLNKDDYKPYFPLEHVTSKMFEIYQTLLQVKFTEVESPPVWVEGVKMYSTRDAGDDRLMGYFFLDMFPRPGKYNHFAVTPIQFSCEDGNKARVVAIAVMMGNFPEGEEGKPPLLDHNNVTTLFHEFGHLMHYICAKTRLPMFSGANWASLPCEADFIECPSQMLENWVWAKTPLTLMSSHFQTGESLPEPMIKKLMETRHVGTGLANLTQIAYALFDQRIHKGGKASTAKAYAEVMKEVLGFVTLPDTNSAASFGHIADGYDASYYSYLWSEVFSADLFETGFGEDGVLSPEKGRRYRDLILEPGGTIDAKDMLRNFLGRDPTNYAFLKAKGLE